MANAYPLAWPAGWNRHSFHKTAAFGRRVESGNGWKSTKPVTLDVARKRLADELDRLGARNVILSTNLELRADGHPRAGRREPEDTGVAVYFDLNGKPTVIACDKWNTIPDNIVAIAKHIEALRGMERWGCGTIEQAFAGYAALPAPSAWWEILGMPDPAGLPRAWTEDEIRVAWAAASRAAHPDLPGGSHDKQAAVNAARDEGIRVARDQ